MTLSRAQASTKAADVAKMLLQNKRQLTHIRPSTVCHVPPPNCNPNRALTLT